MEKQAIALKEETDELRSGTKSNPISVEDRKIRLLQAEIQRLHQEYKDIQSAVNSKEVEIQKKSLEESILNAVEEEVLQCKAEKSELSSKIKELERELNKAKLTLQELRTEKVIFFSVAGVILRKRRKKHMKKLLWKSNLHMEILVPITLKKFHSL